MPHYQRPVEVISRSPAGRCDGVESTRSNDSHGSCDCVYHGDVIACHLTHCVLHIFTNKTADRTFIQETNRCLKPQAEVCFWGRVVRQLRDLFGSWGFRRRNFMSELHVRIRPLSSVHERRFRMASHVGLFLSRAKHTAYLSCVFCRRWRLWCPRWFGLTR